MTYPSELETLFTAKDGQKLFFRPEKPVDTEMLWVMFSTLSEESVSNLIPPFTRERIEGWTSNINHKEVLAVVAVTQGPVPAEIVAAASLKFNMQEVFKHKAELGITVHDNYQNLGVGTALLNHLLTIAKKMELKKIFVNVNVTNARAFNVYMKAGFEVEGTLRKELLLKKEFLDEYRMALFL